MINPKEKQLKVCIEETKPLMFVLLRSITLSEGIKPIYDKATSLIAV